MAAIAAIDVTLPGAQAATKTTLSADDTFTFDPTRKQLLVFDNTTGGSLTANIKGDAATTVNVTGLGTVSVASGLNVVVAAGAQVAVLLSTISSYCAQTAAVHITGAATLKATLFNL
jgi:hypothetical protein